jgi:hypothetical protein
MMKLWYDVTIRHAGQSEEETLILSLRPNLDKQHAFMQNMLIITQYIYHSIEFLNKKFWK